MQGPAPFAFLMILDAGGPLQGAKPAQPPRIRLKILSHEFLPFPDSGLPFTVSVGEVLRDGIFLRVCGVYHGAGRKDRPQIC